MTAAPSHVSQPEVSELDTVARWPLVLLLGSALLWLLLTGVLALVQYVQLLSPGFLAECPALSYGRVGMLLQSTLIYGWVANAGFAVALWILTRLGGAPLRSLNWAVVGWLFWNSAVAIGLVCIVFGQGTSVPYLHFPRFLYPAMTVAFGAIAVPGVLAWTGRARHPVFAAQGYAVAALFLCVWLLSAAQVMLFWAPARGVLQAVIAAWAVQGAWSFWIAPLALAAAYYLVPKITGRVLSGYNFASLGFWTLVVIGPWAGARHLIGGPVPAWLPSVAIVATVLLVFHYLIAALNLHAVFSRGSTALKFAAYGVAAYLLGGFVDAATALRDVAQSTQFTWFASAQGELALLGAFSMTIFGAIYFLVPRLTNRPWPSTPLIRAHFAAAFIGTTGIVLGLAAAGIVQGRDLNNAAVSFADIAAHTRVWLEIAAAAQAVLLFGNALLAFHFVRLLVCRPAVPAASQLQPAPTMEVSVI
ncbi:MAG TPA: cbb3-type cytochrome c oxidase subunit I [Opitutus sp.]|nr:cbb3-type cytochrome c oxidase subunit I [Opitutus sp.]